MLAENSGTVFCPPWIYILPPMKYTYIRKICVENTKKMRNKAILFVKLSLEIILPMWYTFNINQCTFER